ncbi:MAG TPA: hypothetical protein VKT28_01740 [Puia sp.]|nr:hypothetical protein [Puia sp.]
MLVETMSVAETSREIFKDFDKLRNSSALRLAAEYDRERRKLKVDHKKSYPKVYPIKTAAKNTWLLFLSKAPAIEKYKEIDAINIAYVTYYYNSKGLQVFHLSSGGFTEVYSAHFFNRYNERMNLQLQNPIDIVKRYFMRGAYALYSIIPKKGRKYTIGTSVDGFLLGDISHNGEWLMNRTFITRDMSKPDQDEIEHGLICNLKKDIEKAMIFYDARDEDIRRCTNVMNALTKPIKD